MKQTTCELIEWDVPYGSKSDAIDLFISPRDLR